MKKRTLQFIFLLIINHAFSQIPAIPYRDGTKWGVCNPEAKLLIEPKFDKLEFYNNYMEDYQVLFSEIRNLKGLIISGVEILPPVYERIYKKENLYIGVKVENNQKKTDIILPDGKSILTKPIIEVISEENFNQKFHLFHVLNPDFSESVFIYDSNLNTISQWLYEGYYSLDLMKIKDLDNIIFKVKKKENDGLSLDSWNFSKAPDSIVKSKVYYKNEADLMATFQNKTRERNADKNGSGYGSGSGELVTYGDSGGEMVIVDSDKNDKEITKQPVYLSNKFLIEDEKLFLVTQNERIANSPKTKITVALKIPVKDIELKYFTTLVKKNDTINYFGNVVFYKKKNKKGILFSANIKNLMEFDTIAKQGFSIGEDYNSQLVFLVGNKQPKTNTFKYSFYNSSQKLLFPVEFDNLKQSGLTHSNGIMVYVSKIGIKYGIVQNDGTEVIKTEYDEIKEIESSSSAAKIVQAKKNNKYRFIVQKESLDFELKPVFFDYAAKNIITDYPKRYYPDSKESNLSINLLEMVDDNKKFIGYANDNGTLYFKN